MDTDEKVKLLYEAQQRRFLEQVGTFYAQKKLWIQLYIGGVSLIATILTGTVLVILKTEGVPWHIRLALGLILLLLCSVICWATASAHSSLKEQAGNVYRTLGIQAGLEHAMGFFEPLRESQKYYKNQPGLLPADWNEAGEHSDTSAFASRQLANRSLVTTRMCSQPWWSHSLLALLVLITALSLALA